MEACHFQTSRRPNASLRSFAVWLGKAMGPGLSGKNSQCNDIQFTCDTAIPTLQCGPTRNIVVNEINKANQG